MDKIAVRQALIEQRLNLPDRLQRSDQLQRVMRIWLVGRPEDVYKRQRPESVTKMASHDHPTPALSYQ